MEVILAMLAALIGGLLKSVITSLFAGELKGALMACLARRIRRQAADLPPELAEDQAEEWLAELAALKERPLQAIRFVVGLAGASDAIAHGAPPRRVGAVRRLLFWVAGVDTRDLVVPADEVRYSAVGGALLFEFFYLVAAAFLGLRAMMPSASVLATTAQVGASLLVGVSLIAFDRSILAVPREPPRWHRPRRRGGARSRLARIVMRVLLAFVLATAASDMVAQHIYRAEINARVTSNVARPAPVSGGSQQAATPKKDSAREPGGFRERQVALQSFLARDTSALVMYVLTVLLLMSFDLMSVVLVFGGRNSVYVRRQRERLRLAQALAVRGHKTGDDRFG